MALRETSTGTQTFQGSPDPIEAGGDNSKSSRRSLKEYAYAKDTIRHILDGFQPIVKETQISRDLRWLRRIDGKQLRDEGIIHEGEGFYPFPVGDVKIRREQPKYLKFLTQSKRAAILCRPDGKSFDFSDELETAFTNVVRYNSWDVPFIRVIDGMQAHGFDVIEIVYDPTKPGHFAFEHVGHDNLAFSADVENLQAQEILPRTVALSVYQLEEFVESAGFNRDQVDKIVKANPDNKSGQFRLDIIKVEKVFFRESGIVWVAWHHKSCDDWLRSPKPLYLGRRDTSKPKVVVPGKLDDLGQPVSVYPPIFETEFPFVLFKYTETEDPTILSIKGRIELDEPTQEAASIMNTSLVNQTYRASFLTGSPKPMPGNTWKSSGPKQLSIPIEDGVFWDTPMDFYYLPAPDISAMSNIERQLTLSYSGDAQVNYASLNRPDTEKTATEINTANQESAELSSVQVTLLSTGLGQVFAKAFIIWQSRVASGELQVSEHVASLLFTSDVAPGNPEAKIVTLIPYTLKPSGDIDVVKKQETLARRQQFWPVVLETIKLGGIFYQNIFGVTFFKDLVRSMFPDDAEKYIEAIDQQAMSNQLLTQLADLVNQLATNEKGEINPAIPQEQIPQLQATLQLVGQLTQGTTK